MDPVTRALLSEFVTQHELTELAEDKQFEHFTAYNIVSSRYSEDFSTHDLVYGGGNDLGIDAFAIIVNGRLISDEQEIMDLLSMNGYLGVEFVFIQAKRTPAFDGGKILSLCQNIKNAVFLNDVSLPRSEQVQYAVDLVQHIYSYAAKFRGNPECRIYYVTTGNWQDDAYLKSIIDRQVQELYCTNMFSSVRIFTYGAQQIQKAYRETKYSISRQILFDKLVVLPMINRVQASYLGALPASEFLKLICDDDNNIVKSIFIDNIRDFQGDNPVNKDMAQTLDSGLLDQFVLRNNGVTIVARDLSITGQNFTVRDYQIVNGCQTSHVLFSHRERVTDNLFVPVKLIHTDDEEITQDVIKSTNRQTPIEENDLLALTKFQKDLETYYAGFAQEKRLYYERRSKQYAEHSEKTRIVSIGNQLKVFASMFLDSAHQAGRYQATLLRAVGDKVFKATHRWEPYYTSAFAYYRFDHFLKRSVSESADLRAFKFHLLAAYRYRYEPATLPPLENKGIAGYCEDLNKTLWDFEKAREAFENCAQIIRRAATARNLEIVRDSAKVRDLTDAIRDIAAADNPLTNVSAGV